jgi:hypothetical protein
LQLKPQTIIKVVHHQAVIQHLIIIQHPTLAAQDQAAVDAMRKRGLTVHKPNTEQLREWQALADSLYPRAHTCFNKLDLPTYDSQAELEAYLSIVISTEITGFTIE